MTDKQQQMALAVGGVAGAAVGTGVMLAVGAVPFGDIEGTFWGLVFGVPAGALTFAISLVMIGRGGAVGRGGRFALAAVLGLVGVATAWWIIMWGIPPVSEEGWYLWVAAVVGLLGSVLALRAARRARASGTVHAGPRAAGHPRATG